jgi:hypothetical protein
MGAWVCVTPKKNETMSSGSADCLRVIIKWPTERQILYLTGRLIPDEVPHEERFIFSNSPSMLFIRAGRIYDSSDGYSHPIWHDIMIRATKVPTTPMGAFYPKAFGYHAIKVWHTQAKGAGFALMCALRKLTVIDKNVVTAVGRMVVDSESDSDWEGGAQGSCDTKKMK